jgi:DNA-binding NarL/FixJ family response regulator
MLKARGAGDILKKGVAKEMIQVLRTVVAGDVYLSQSISGIVVSDYKKTPTRDRSTH